ncbi:ABC transporter ATP-binding protein [Labrys sp. 22185]|uniref:ABC transporter ATP-binding protein n=1 Tax=Labrys sp. 22185 TaxID=3453888 RepID=UPI003F83A76C
MIELDHISKLYDGRRVVDDLSLQVAQGSVCVLIGPSGCGKSTTLRMINALVTADEGRILVDGQDVRAVDPAELRRRIGYVIQSGGLFPHWSVADNIATVPRLLRWPEAKVSARVAELVRLVGLDGIDTDRRFPHQLSGGQQQRVGVARALAADPPVLLMDEPFGALDPVTRRSLQDELHAIHASTGKTIVFVTHDMDEALKLADRVVVMDGGRIVQDGPPHAIVTDPASDLIRGFVGGEEALLRLLARLTVADAMRAVETATDAATIGKDESLSVALSRMLVHGRLPLSVLASDGQPVGRLTFEDLSAVLAR